MAHTQQVCAQREEGIMKDLIVYVAERFAFFPFIVILLYILWDNIKSIIESNQEEEEEDDE